MVLNPKDGSCGEGRICWNRQSKT